MANPTATKTRARPSKRPEVAGMTDPRLLSANELAAIRAGNHALGEYRADRQSEFLEALVWRGEQITRLLDHAEALERYSGGLLMDTIEGRDMLSGCRRALAEAEQHNTLLDGHIAFLEAERDAALARLGEG